MSKIPKVRYLQNGEVIEVDPVELAKWYTNRFKGAPRTRPPGEPLEIAVDFDLPLHDYDDPDWFLDELARLAQPKDEDHTNTAVLEIRDLIRSLDGNSNFWNPIK